MELEPKLKCQPTDSCPLAPFIGRTVELRRRGIYGAAGLQRSPGRRAHGDCLNGRAVDLPNARGAAIADPQKIAVGVAFEVADSLQMPLGSIQSGRVDNVGDLAV